MQSAPTVGAARCSLLAAGSRIQVIVVTNLSRWSTSPATIGFCCATARLAADSRLAASPALVCAAATSLL